MHDDERFVRFGTALDPLDEDEIPSKKPINIEDQIVTDENGRRRFHGAFTGGFSAGYWNTVGSQEGWKPANFKSSRSEKADRQSQKATDYMDDEDLGEFGIAPQRLQAKEDFSKDRKRKLQQQSYGPIPGVPVLSQMLEPSRDKVAVRLLKQMGWKPGQGIGARQTRSEKKTVKNRNDREMYVMQKYGCEVAPSTSKEISDSSESEEEEVTFAPDDFEPFACALKSNTFGLGYTGLGGLKESAKGRSLHVNLFDGVELLDKNNRKVSIRGQAFGVGALEEEDADIYERDDMSKYDFEMGGKKNKKKKRPVESQDLMVIEGFQAASVNSIYHKKIFSIKLPHSFVPRNWLVRKTRFAPMDELQSSLLKKTEEHMKRGLGRHDLKPDERGNILGESSKSKPIEKKKENHWLEKIAQSASNFEKGQVITEKGEEVNLYDSARKENEEVLEKAVKITKHIDTSGVFKPFAGNEEKQVRYEKFIESKLFENEEIAKFLDDIQPFQMSPWDREKESKEFVQARKIYQPLQGIMGERFVTEATVVAEKEQEKPKYDEKNQLIVTRIKKMWKPCPLICKRFNIPEPFGGSMMEEKVEKKQKFSVFDYLETSINKKSDFVTPVIIPKAKEAVKPLITQSPIRKVEDPREEVSEPTVEMSAKEFFKGNKDIVVIPTTSQLVVNTKPKTELEQKIEERKDQHPSEKKDIFKAIFDDSEEEEEEEEIPEKPPISSNILTSLTKPAAEANLVRNSSPPRGIFAALFTKKPKEKTEVPEEKKEEVMPELAPDQYGPKLPEKLQKQPSQLDDKLLRLLKESTEEKWVEKSSSDKKVKKKKKHKKKSRSSDESDSSDDGRSKKKKKHKKKVKKSRK